MHIKNPNISDEELMQRLQQGSEEAFNALYRRYGKKLHSFFWRMLNNDTNTAEDFTQQLFMKIIENTGRFNTRKKFSTWVFAIASNMVKNEYRSRERLNNRKQMANHWHTDDSLDFINNLDENNKANTIQAAINNLDEKHKQCFLLRHQQGYSIKEISEVINRPEGTVKSRLHYAIKQLSSSLKKLNYS